MIRWPGVLNQVIRDPGDADDCWVVATFWAARASDPGVRIPSIDAFRRAAGKPDRPGSQGGNLDDIMRGCREIWPGLAVTRYRGAWEAFAGLVRGGRPASLAVLSSKLPARLRYGFLFPHQIGVAWDGAAFVVANPLAPEGSAPQRIDAPTLRAAAEALLSTREVLAAVFPAPRRDAAAYRAGVRRLRPFWLYRRDGGRWTRALKVSRGGFSAPATARAPYAVLGSRRLMTELQQPSAYAGTWLDVTGKTAATNPFYRKET